MVKAFAGEGGSEGEEGSEGGRAGRGGGAEDRNENDGGMETNRSESDTPLVPPLFIMSSPLWTL